MYRPKKGWMFFEFVIFIKVFPKYESSKAFSYSYVRY
jgi:hypothetical protein